MVEIIDGIGSDSGAGESDFLKGDEGTVTPDEGKVVDPAKPQEDANKPGTSEENNPDQELRSELAKRYGEGKSDQELLAEVWKSYRNGETTFTQTQEKVKELEGLVNQFGGVDTLKAALTAPAPSAEPGNKYPDKIQTLIDSGHLDPNDPRDAIIIDQEIRLEQNKQAIGQSTHKEAVQTFEAGLKDIAGKYEYADLDIVRELGYKGAFANMTDAQMWQAVDGIMSKQHNKVMGLVDTKTQEKLNKLKELNEKKPLDGQPGGGKATKLSAKQAFEKTYSEHFNE